jgi:hypothetical protein
MLFRLFAVGTFVFCNKGRKRITARKKKESETAYSEQIFAKVQSLDPRFEVGI